MIYEIHYVVVALIIALLFLKHKTSVKIYGIFAGMLNIYLAIEFAVNDGLILTTVLSLFAVYLFYDAIYR